MNMSFLFDTMKNANDVNGLLLLFAFCFLMK